MRLILSGILSFFMGIVAITVIFGSWYTIDQRERGVILRNGAIIGEATPGLGFKLPWVDGVARVSIETHTIRYEKLSAYSRDQQPAEIILSVTYRIPVDGVVEVYGRFGDIEKLVDRTVTPKVREQVKNTFGQFNAVTAIQERARLNSETAGAIHSAISAMNIPLIIEAVQIENIDFSDSYEQSIEQRMQAEVEVQKLRQNAEREKVQADIVVTQANARANAVRAEAQASADAIKLKGEAEAIAIRARGEALKDNPLLPILVQAERWDGRLPVTMIPGASVPMLNLAK